MAAKKKKAPKPEEIEPPERNGILAGGNFIVDHVKVVDHYPEQEMLASILSESMSNGGGPYNVLKDLSLMGAKFPLSAVGLLGDDEAARWILDDCSRHEIDTSRLRLTSQSPTSYTDAFTVRGTGRRTFFHQRGANALLRHEDFDFSKTRAKIFHFGYFLLLDALDRFDDSGRTGASRVLEAAGEAGLITSADAVSTENERFSEVIKSSLPYLNYLFLNEIETGRVTGLRLRQGGEIQWEVCEEAARALIALSVKDLAVIHFPEGAVACRSDGQIFRQHATALPETALRGASGAGDAFAAGVLYGLHENWDVDRSLKLGVCAAAACLGHPSTSEGVFPVEECMAIGEEYGYRG
ncbi:MAG: carbohydrate kinase family protein [Verrucomicrobiae bacterium]|nr:carbohydrate kinase family protein [Verrucomicrobiae bacterium]